MTRFCVTRSGWPMVAHINRILPVSSSCIMPCLMWRALASLVSNAAISVSMSLRMAAMAVCSLNRREHQINFGQGTRTDVTNGIALALARLLAIDCRSVQVDSRRNMAHGSSGRRITMSTACVMRRKSSTKATHLPISSLVFTGACKQHIAGLRRLSHGRDRRREIQEWNVLM